MEMTEILQEESKAESMWLREQIPPEEWVTKRIFLITSQKRALAFKRKRSSMVVKQVVAKEDQWLTPNILTVQVANQNIPEAA